MEAAQSDRKTPVKEIIAPEEAEALRKKESLLLARKRLVDQIAATQNPRYREMLEKALAHLDATLARQHGR